MFTVCVCQAKSLLQQMEQEINVCSLFVFVRPRASCSRWIRRSMCVHCLCLSGQEPLAADGSGDQCMFTVCVCQAKSLLQQMDQEINVCSLFVFVRPRASCSRWIRRSMCVHCLCLSGQEPLAADGSGDQCVFTVCVCQAKSLLQQMDQEINVCSLFVFVRPRASRSRWSRSSMCVHCLCWSGQEPLAADGAGDQEADPAADRTHVPPAVQLPATQQRETAHSGKL